MFITRGQETAGPMVTFTALLLPTPAYENTLFVLQSDCIDDSAGHLTKINSISK